MKMRSLKYRILWPSMGVILLLGLFIGIFGIYVIQRNIVDRAQSQVNANLRAARMVYREELESIQKGFELVFTPSNESMAAVKSRLGLDYLYTVDSSMADSIASPIVREAFKGNRNGGTRIISADELRSMNNSLFRMAQIPVEKTPHSRPSVRTLLQEGMALEYATPFFSPDGRVIRVVYGGKLVNRRFELVDRIHSIVFENRMYRSKPVGTVTIFLDDTRIATNVLDKSGQRAIGTCVSSEVYDNVIIRGISWFARAFVVTDWYLTAYEPIEDVVGRRIGILYVGILEQPFNDMRRQIGLVFAAIIGAGMVLATILSFIMAGVISSPITRMLRATNTLSDGNLSHRINVQTSVRELHSLADAFNDMAKKLEERDNSLRETNEKLAELNKNYLDMVGVVSHELKGILSSTIINTYSIKDRFFGDINEKQEKALNSIARNLDYLTITVKRFLDLSRIEKGEMIIHPTEFRLREDVCNTALEAFQRQAEEKKMSMVFNVPADIKIKGDLDMIQIVANNLIRNAIVYGQAGKPIVFTARDLGATVEVDVYNDGTPIPAEARQRLFKKFSRLDTAEGKKVRGTGLGLFVTRDIVEKHGGAITCEPREQGNSFIFTIKKDCQK
ncbi:MAG: HAMP domain-containing protein [Spirochaetales bacterium]|nr:MAG: HAMP domain-containing protein [Spirochaetales bacterium]